MTDNTSPETLAALAAAVPSALFGAFVGTLVAGPLGLLVGGVLGAGSGAFTARTLASASGSRDALAHGR